MVHTDDNPVDSRRSHRETTQVPFCCGLRGDTKHGTGLIRDFSSHGAQIIVIRGSMGKLLVGEEIEVRLSRPGQAASPLIVKGIVRWNGGIRIGIEFKTARLMP